MKESQAKRFCKCIKQVRRTVKIRRGTREGAAIAICTKSLLQTKGRTLRKVKCRGKPKLVTQELIV